jgi:16S rRNA (cytidine1402-2'-O)-methyltransferase
VPKILEVLEQGQEVALISEAGTPLISDPGAKIVRACHKAGYPVRPIPGPCAPITALMVSGFQVQPFTFLGFLPRKLGDKRRVFLDFAGIRTTLVFLERKSRLKNSLDLAYDVFGDREVCLARELTKRHEEITICSLGHLPDTLSLKGEFTVVIGPGQDLSSRTSEEEVRALVVGHMQQRVRPKEAIDHLAGQVQGWSRKELYKLYITLIKGLEEPKQ